MPKEIFKRIKEDSIFPFDDKELKWAASNFKVFLYWFCVPSKSVNIPHCRDFSFIWKPEIFCFNVFDVPFILFSSSKVVCSILVNKLPGNKDRLKGKKKKKKLYDSIVIQYNQFFPKKWFFCVRKIKKEVLIFHFFLHAHPRSKREKKKSEKEKGRGELANDKTLY